MDELQALHAGAVRPAEGKSTVPEGPDGEIRGSRGSPIRVRDMDPPKGPLQQAPYNSSRNVASNPRNLVQVAKKTYPLLQRRPPPN